MVTTIIHIKRGRERNMKSKIQRDRRKKRKEQCFLEKKREIVFLQIKL